MILEESTTIFSNGKQVAGIKFDLVASNGLKIIGVAAEKDVSHEVFAKAGSYL